MENVNDIAPQGEEITADALPQADDEVNAALAMFDLVPDEQPEEEESEDAPPIEPEAEEPEPEKKGRTYKYNKEEVFVPEEQVDEYARKGLNYDKVEGRAKEYEAALERTAKLNGFNSHKEYMENLDRLEQEALQHKDNEFNTLKQDMIDQLEAAGYDPEQVSQFIDNHPVLKQAQEVLEREKQANDAIKAQQAEVERVKGWQDLLEKYPHLNDEVSEDGTAPWITPEMQSRINKGYDPIDAYELAHRDTISVNQRKLAEQELLKQQRLNKRSAVLGAVKEDLEPAVPKEITDAFALFGLDPKSAKKYVK